MGGVSTGNIAALPISFHNVPLTSLNDAAFEVMFAEVTDTDSAVFDLSGTADVTAKTSIGDVPISGIPFDVTSTLKGKATFLVPQFLGLPSSTQASTRLEARLPLTTCLLRAAVEMAEMNTLLLPSQQ
jgi:hypothetical protein